MRMRVYVYWMINIDKVIIDDDAYDMYIHDEKDNIRGDHCKQNILK
jgi:hypothetical protein